MIEHAKSLSSNKIIDSEQHETIKKNNIYT